MQLLKPRNLNVVVCVMCELALPFLLALSKESSNDEIKKLNGQLVEVYQQLLELLWENQRDEIIEKLPRFEALSDFVFENPDVEIQRLQSQAQTTTFLMLSYGREPVEVDSLLSYFSELWDGSLADIVGTENRIQFPEYKSRHFEDFWIEWMYYYFLSLVTTQKNGQSLNAEPAIFSANHFGKAHLLILHLP